MSTARRSASPSRHALALLGLISALPPVLRADDNGCVPSPEDGIFCDEDPGNFTVVDHVIAGEVTESWDNQTYTDPFSVGTHFHNINLAADSRLTIHGSGDNLARPLLWISGAGALRIASGSVLFGRSGEVYSGHLVDYSYSGGVEIVGGDLTVKDNAALGTGAVSLAGTGTLRLSNSGALSQARGFSVSGTTTRLEVYQNPVEITGVVSGDGRLNLSGNVTLSAVNTHTGGTRILDGTLSISADHHLGAADTALTLENGTTLIATAGFASSARELVLSGATSNFNIPSAEHTVTWNGTTSGAGNLVKQGAGTLTLAGMASHSGDTIVSSGTLRAGAAGAFSPNSLHSVPSGATLALDDYAQTIGGLAGAGSVSLGSASLTVNQSADSTFSGVISGTGGLIKTGAGALTLSGVNTYSGGTTFGGGTLIVSSESALGDAASPFTFDGGTLQTLAGLTSARAITLAGGGGTLSNGSGADSTFSGVISGPGAFTKTGAGSLTLSGTNTYSGVTTVSAGTLHAGAVGALSANSVHSVASGATIDLDNRAQTIGGLGGAGSVSLGSATLAINQTGSSTFSGVISGTGGLTQTGAGALTLSGVNTYTGTTTVSGGTLNTGAAGALNANSNLVLLGGATVNLQGHDQTVASLESRNAATGLPETSTINLGGATLTSRTLDSDMWWSGALVGPGNFVKQDDGSMRWSGANTFEGTLRVEGGILYLDTANTLSPNADVFIGDEALIRANGAQTITGLSGSGTYYMEGVGGGPLTLNLAQDSTFSGTFGGNGGLIKNGPGTLTLAGSGFSFYSGPNIISAGTLRVVAKGKLSDSSVVRIDAGATLDLVDFGQSAGGLEGSGSVTLNGPSLTLITQAGHTFSGTISGSGRLVFGYRGVQTLSGNNTYSGGTTFGQGYGAGQEGVGRIYSDSALGAAGGGLTFNDGILQLSGDVTSARTIKLVRAGTLTTDASTASTFSGAISGSGPFTKAGAGALTLSGINTHTGTTTVSGGVLNTGIAGALSADSNLVLNGGATINLHGHDQTVANLDSRNAATGLRETSTIDLGGATLTNRNLVANFWAGSLVGQGDFIKKGASTMRWYNSNTFEGTLRVDAGTLVLEAADVLSPDAVLSIGSSGFVRTSHRQTIAGLSGSGYLSFEGSTGASLTIDQNADSTFSGTLVMATGGVTKKGTGTLTLASSTYIAYSGPTVVSAGTLRVLTPRSVTDSSVYQIAAGASLELANLEESGSIAALEGSGNVTLDASSLTLVGDYLNGPAQNVFSGTISGTGGLIKTGYGTQTLSGLNTYSGGTTLGTGWGEGQGGILRVSSDSALGQASGGLTFNQGILQLSGNVHSARTVSLVDYGTVSTDAGTASTFSGAISGTGAFVKAGAGALTLSGANTHSGGTTVDDGTLLISADSALGHAGGVLTFEDGTLQTLATITSARPITLASGGGTVSTATGTASTFSGVISGAGALTKTGAGSLTLSGANTYTGPTTVSAGTLRAGAAGAFGSSSAYSVASGATLDLNGHNQTLAGLTGAGAVTLGSGRLTLNPAADTTFSGTIAGAGGLTKLGLNTLTLSGANTYSGHTTVSAGTLRTGAAGVLSANSAYFLIGGSTLDLDGRDQTVGDLDSYDPSTGNFYAPSTLALGGATLTNLTRVTNNWGGALTGTGTFIKRGAAAMNWAGQNTFTGTLHIDAGKVAAQTANTLSPNASVTLAAGTTLELNNHAQTIASLSGAGSVALGSATLTLAQGGDSIFSGVISGTGSLSKTGAGALTLSGTNTYSGGTTLSGGTLRVSADTALGGAAGGLTLNGGTLQTLADFTSARAITLASGGGTVSTDAGTSATLSGVLSGAGSFTKAGAGTLTLSGVNTNSGATTVSSGTLRAGAAGAFGSSSAYSVASGATLDLNNHAQTLSALSGAGSVALGSATLTLNQAADASFSGAISGSGAFTKTGPGVVTLAGANTYTGDTTVSAGTLRAGAANAFSAGSNHSVATGATLGLNNHDQTIGGLTGAGSVSLGSATLTVAQDSDATFSGIISSTGSLAKTGAGALTLSGANTYSGDTTVSAGTLRVNAGSSIGSGALSIDGTLDLHGTTYAASGLSGAGSLALGSATLTLNQTGNTTFSGAISGTGALTKTGAGTLTLGGSATHSGGTVVRNGTLAAGAANAFSANSALFVVNGATVSLNSHNQTVGDLDSYDAVTGNYYSVGTVQLGGATLTNLNRVTNNWGGSLTGNGTFVKKGAATMNWAGPNTFTGTLQIDAGTVSTQALGTLSPNAAVVIAAGASLNLNGGAQTIAGLSGAGGVQLGSGTLSTNQAGDSTFSGAFSGTGSLVKSGAGTLTLTGANSLSNLTANAGAIRVAADSALGRANGTVTLDGGTLATTASFGSSRITSLGSAGGTFETAADTTLAWNGAIGGSGALTKTGAGTLAVGGANSFTGPMQISAGTVRAAAANTLGDSVQVTLSNGATLDLNHFAHTLGGLSGAGSVNLGSAALALAQNTSSTFSGIIGGTGSLTKSGTGTLTLSGGNTYSGGTVVKAGTLRAGHVNAFGSGDLEISGGTVDFNGLAIANPIVNRGGSLTGLAAYTGTQTIAGNVSFSGTVGGSVSVAPAASLNTTGATFTGPVTVQSGGTLSGTGTLGTLTIAAGGTLSPGNSPGLLTIGDGSTLSGTTLIELGGLDRSVGYDAIDVLAPGGGLGSVTVGGTLSVVFWNSWAPSGTASFEIFRASSIGGTFAQIELPTLAAGYEWSTARLLSHGMLDLVTSAIPEPASATWLLGLAGAGIAFTRRARRDR